MKTFPLLRRSLVLNLAGAASLCVYASASSLAAGGGTATGTTGGGAVGGAAAGGGHGGGASAGHAGGSIQAGGGGRVGGVSAGQHLGSPGFNNPGGGRLVSPNFGNLSRPTFGNGSVANLGQVGGRSVAPGAASRSGGTGLGTVASPQYAGTRPAYQPAVPIQPRNAWTDPRASRPAAPAARTGRYGYNNAYDAGQSSPRNQTTPGQHLSPGAPDYATARDLNGRLRQFPVHGYGAYERGENLPGHGYRQNYHRSYHNTVFLYPYFFGGFFPGYYDGFDAGLGSYAGIETPYSSDLANGETNTPNTNPGNYGYDPNRGQVTPPAQPSDESTSLPPNPPEPVDPAGPQAAEKHITNNDGPDSLVEAVQQELAKRGYLNGKVDGTYGDTTRAALERFQTDQKISKTGRINEATLHALQLD